MSANEDAGPTIERMRERLLIAPFHRWLGLNLVGLNAGELALEMPWRDEIVSNPKLSAAHGIVSALIDLTGLYAVLAFGGTGRATVNLHVDFHRPATPGLLRAIGRPIKLGRQISVAETRVVSAEGKLLATIDELDNSAQTEMRMLQDVRSHFAETGDGRSPRSRRNSLARRPLHPLVGRQQ